MSAEVRNNSWLGTADNGSGKKKQNLGYAMAQNARLSCFDTEQFSGIGNLLENAKIAALNNAQFKINGKMGSIDALRNLKR